MVKFARPGMVFENAAGISCMHKTPGTLYIGTSNIVLPGPKTTFPEAYRSGSRLHYYSSLFNSLEVNSTFYKLPMASTLEKWAGDVPDNFTFTLKLWREITHTRHFTFMPEYIERFMEIAESIGRRKGCLLIQFPASVTADRYAWVKETLEHIATLNTAPAWRACVEFRHPGWYEHEAIARLLSQLRMSFVLHDMPRSKPPLDTVPGPVVYLRFHGPAGDYKGGYNTSTLHEYAAFIAASLKAGQDVYVYFNNTLGDALQNAQCLQQLTGYPAINT
jgi:uncharacterized protein YecE (DUF72 family)